MKEAIEQLIIKEYQNIENRNDLEAIKRVYCKKFILKSISNAEILAIYQDLLANNKINRSKYFEKILKTRAVRTISGVAPVAVLTKYYPCPGNCAYCPREDDVPVSYLSNEPAVMRAIRCNYDPYRQVIARLRALEDNGHEPNKIELIVIGGTWSYLPEKYQYWYIASCFQASNDYNKIKKLPLGEYFKMSSRIKENTSLKQLKEILAKEQKKNEIAKYRIIGLTLETRPDYINKKELEKMRNFACTRVEIGVQAIDDKILEKNKRGHDVKSVIEASKLLKNYGFKLTYHIMPALPGSNPKKDLEMFNQLFSDSNFRPDQIKFYPTTVIKQSLLYKWYQQGLYKPYTDKELRDLIIACKKIVPPYLRIIRLIRDIPSESIEAGNKVTNLRQVMQRQGAKCDCIRCREVKDAKLLEHKMNVLEYESSGGKEFFISIDSLDNKVLYGFCRLRLDENSLIADALVRELHVYGQLVPVGSKKIIQHRGFGKSLMLKAEQIAKKQGAKNIAVISGVGVKDYYRKLSYRQHKTYMFKKL